MSALFAGDATASAAKAASVCASAAALRVATAETAGRFNADPEEAEKDWPSVAGKTTGG